MTYVRILCIKINTLEQRVGYSLLCPVTVNKPQSQQLAYVIILLKRCFIASSLIFESQNPEVTGRTGTTEATLHKFQEILSISTQTLANNEYILET